MTMFCQPARHESASFAILFVAALATTSAAAAQDVATIQKLNDAFTVAFNKGDFATVGSMYTEGAYLLPPGTPMIKGRPNVQAFWAKAGESISDVNLTALDVKPLGDEAAREVGSFSLMVKGQQQPMIGKYVVVWEKVGGEWKLATDIWNVDK